MLRILQNKRAQNTIEYALIIAVVIGAFTAMQLYNRRAISMRVKKGMDNIPFAILGSEKSKDARGNDVSYLFDADGKTTFLGVKDEDLQYEPYYYAKGQYNMSTTSTEGSEATTIDAARAKGQRSLMGQTNQRTGVQDVTGWNDKD